MTNRTQLTLRILAHDGIGPDGELLTYWEQFRVWQDEDEATLEEAKSLARQLQKVYAQVELSYRTVVRTVDEVKVNFNE